MQAIITRVIPATNTLPTRIKASAARGSLIIAPPDQFQIASEEAHRIAAHRLIAHFVAQDRKQYGPEAGAGWLHPFLSGCLPSGDWAHVFKTAQNQHLQESKDRAAEWIAGHPELAAANTASSTLGKAEGQS